MANKNEEGKFDYDFLKGTEDNMAGFEDINSQTMAIPFLRLLQTLSPQLKRTKPEFIEGAQEGQFFNSVTKEVYGSEIKLVVLKFEHIYIEWLPERKGFVDYHTPENAEKIAIQKDFGKWLTKEGNILQENYVYLVVVEGHIEEGVMVFSLASTNIKAAREWNRLMTTHLMDNGNRAMPYYLVWKISSSPRQKDEYDWQGIDISFDRYIKENEYHLISGERKALPERKVDYALLESKNQEEITDTPY